MSSNFDKSDPHLVPQLADVSGRAAARLAPVRDEEEAGADPARMIEAVKRHKWLILAAAVVGTAVGVVASRFVQLEYSTDGRIWIAGSGSRAQENQGPIRTGELLESYSWIELLKSFVVMEHVVREERLYISVAKGASHADFQDATLAERARFGSYRYTVLPNGKSFVLTTLEGGEIQRGASQEKVGEAVGFSWTPPAHLRAPAKVVEFTLRPPRDVAMQLQNQIVPRMVPDGRFLQLTYRGTDPVRISAILNAVMTRFVFIAAQLKRQQLDELTKILNEQRLYAEQALKDAEIALETFGVQTITLPSEQGAPIAAGVQQTQAPVLSNYFNMKVQQEDLRRDRVALEDILRRTQSGELTMDALVAVPAARSSPVLTSLLNDLTTKRVELRTLQERYTNEHGPVRTLLGAIATLETNTIPRAVRDLVAQLSTQERSIDAQIASASRELQQIPPRQMEENRLQRNVLTAANLHGELRQRYETAKLAAVSSIPDVSIIDPAEPPGSPVADLRRMVIAGFGAGAVGLALLGVVLRDRRDRRVRYPEQVTEMGLPILGALPHVKDGLNTRDREAAIQLAEAFRELRLSLVHAHGSAGPLMVSVTSPESGDGKSTVAGSLAAVFAGQGYRVVLVDGDIRRGDLHRSLGLRRVPGLTDYLAGRAQLDEVRQACDRGFTLVGSGTRMQSGPELLGSPAMSQLIRDLRTQYDVIIVDTPPLGAGVDAYVLGTATGNMILVLRTGSTDGELAQAKLELLDRLPVRVLGAVLNDVPQSRIYRHYSYLPGYQAEDEGYTPVSVVSLTDGSEDN